MDATEGEWSPLWEWEATHTQGIPVEEELLVRGFPSLLVDSSGSSSWETGEQVAPAAYCNNYSCISSDSNTPTSSKNKTVVMEKKRRQNLNDKLLTLLRLIPNNTKMDKASILKDAIKYIQELKQQEKLMEEEISELEWRNQEQMTTNGILQKKRKTIPLISPNSLELLKEVKVSEVGNGTWAVSIVCKKKRDATVRVCELIESLHLKIISANISSTTENLLHTLLVQIDDINTALLKEKIEAAITEFNTPTVPMILY